MPDQERQPEDLRIPLHVEEISVSRREIKKANVQVALVTGTREQLIDEELTQVRVEIERVPMDRTVVPPIRQEGDITIIPVVEEIVVVELRSATDGCRIASFAAYARCLTRTRTRGRRAPCVFSS